MFTALFYVLTQSAEGTQRGIMVEAELWTEGPIPMLYCSIFQSPLNGIDGDQNDMHVDKY